MTPFGPDPQVTSRQAVAFDFEIKNYQRLRIFGDIMLQMCKALKRTAAFEMAHSAYSGRNIQALAFCKNPALMVVKSCTTPRSITVSRSFPSNPTPGAVLVPQ